MLHHNISSLDKKVSRYLNHRFTLLKDASFLLIASKDKVHFSLVTAYVCHGSLDCLGDPE